MEEKKNVLHTRHSSGTRNGAGEPGPAAEEEALEASRRLLLENAQAYRALAGEPQDE